MKEILKKVYRRVVPQSVRSRISKIKNKNTRGLFLVVDFMPYEWGPLTSWTHYAIFLRYATEKHLVPVFFPKYDKKFIPILEKEYRENANMWNLYFDQPILHFSFKLKHFFRLYLVYARRYGFLRAFRFIFDNPETLVKEISKSRYAIINGAPDASFLDEIRTGNLPLSDKYFSFYSRMYRTFPFSREVLEYAENLKEELFPQKEKILGVSVRRAFEWYHYYRNVLTPEGTHGIRGTTKTLLLNIKEKLYQYDCKYFFLTCDDREFLDIVKSEFGAACIFQGRPLEHLFKNGNPVDKNDWKERYSEYFKRGRAFCRENREYLADIYLLSCCNSLLSAGSSADIMAYIINNEKYEHFYQIPAKYDSDTHVDD